MLLSGMESFSERSACSFTRTALVEGERRHVAALFLDLKDFTSLSESMDHEAVHSLVGGVMKVLAGVVDAYGGYVDKIEGDRIMALFGATRSGENDSIRSVSCAMEMLSTIKSAREYLSSHDISISARAGIACGSVTVAPDALGHLTAMGDTINLASRLEGLADEGTVLVSGRVCRECGDHFLWQNCGIKDIRGRASTVETWMPLGPGPVQTERWRKSAGVARAPLTGRSRELEMLEELFEKQSSRSTGVNRLGGSRHIAVNVTGPVGIGKSRLVNELIEWHKGENWTVLRGYSRAFAQPPFTVWSTLLRNLLGIEQGASDASAALESRLELTASIIPGSEHAEAISSSAAFLSTLLSLEAYHELENEFEEKNHLDLTTSVRNLIRAMGAGGRVIVVLEDMHNADPASLDTLSFLLSNCHLPNPLLVICLDRTQADGSATCSSLESEYCEVHRIEISPLGDDECRGIMEHMVGPQLPDAAVQWLTKRAGGNPLYLIELLRYLVDSGRLDEIDGRWVLADSLDDSVPDSLAGLVRARIDRMVPEARKVLQYCSVLGQQFSLAHFREYSLMAGLQNDSEESLSDLCDRGFLNRHEKTSGVEYSFSNPLFCHSAYDTLLHFNRKTLHRMAAEAALETMGSQAAGSAPLIAHHWAEAGSIENAVKWGLTALDLYSASCQHDEVVQWVQKLEDWLKNWDDVLKQELTVKVLLKHQKTLALTGNTDREKEVLDRLLELTSAETCSVYRPRVMALFGTHCFNTGNHGQASSFYHRALGGAKKLKNTELQADLLNRIGTLSRTTGRTAQAEEYFKKALDAALSAGAASIQADVLTELGTLSLNRGKTADALTFYEQARTIADSEGNRHLKVNVLANLGMTMSILERNSDALEYFGEALAESRETGNRKAEGVILGNMGILNQNLGNMDAALESLESALTIARETGARGSEGIVLGNLGILHNQQGRLFKARECYSRSLEIRREVGNRRGQAVALLNIGSLDLEMGSTRSAEDCYRKALEISRQIDSPKDETVALGNLSRVHLKLGRLDRAEKLAREALQIAERIEVPKSVVSNLNTLGLILIENEHTEEARTVLSRALKLSREIGRLQDESLILGALGCLNLISGSTETALVLYSESRFIIERLKLGERDMEMFHRLREGLFEKGVDRSRLDLPSNWHRNVP